MPIPAEYESFWRAAELELPQLDRTRFLEAFSFGSDERMATVLANLVLSGTKRATASLAWSFEHDKKAQPCPGDISIVTTWDKTPLCVIETTAVEIVPFEEVSEEFARVEGEDDKTLESWRRNHTAFFEWECKRIGQTPSPRMPILCERFSVLYQAASVA